MGVMTESDILTLIKADPWMMGVLEVADTLKLPQWVIGAGFVRNTVWNHLSDNDGAPHATDIDLVYFDPTDINESTEKALEQDLKAVLDVAWSVKNLARMHLVNKDDPYISTEDAVAHWPETATAIGVTIENGELQLMAPCGIDDLVNMIVRPCPKFKGGIDVVKARVQKKGWLELWPPLRIEG